MMQAIPAVVPWVDVSRLAAPPRSTPSSSKSTHIPSRRHTTPGVSSGLQDGWQAGCTLSVNHAHPVAAGNPPRGRILWMDFQPVRRFGAQNRDAVALRMGAVRRFRRDQAERAVLVDRRGLPGGDERSTRVTLVGLAGDFHQPGGCIQGVAGRIGGKIGQAYPLLIGAPIDAGAPEFVRVGHFRLGNKQVHPLGCAAPFREFLPETQALRQIP